MMKRLQARRKAILALGLGVMSLVLAAAALVGMQVCFTQSFWLHAMVFPINPQTIAQPTALTYVGAACELACAGFFLAGMGSLVAAVWMFVAR